MNESQEQTRLQGGEFFVNRVISENKMLLTNNENMLNLLLRLKDHHHDDSFGEGGQSVIYDKICLVIDSVRGKQ